MSLLDCGCGVGSITLGLAGAVAPGHVTGIDISEVAIEQARARVAQHEAENLRFELGDACDLAFQDRAFDAVFAHNVLEHLADPLGALIEMRRVLQPGGMIGIRDSDMGGNLLAPPEGLWHQWFAIYEDDWRSVGGDSRFGRRVRGLLGEAGFADIHASASYEVYCDIDARRLLGEIAASRCTESDFVGRVVTSGRASPETLEAMRTAWLAWAERPDAFFAIAHGEAVGRKA
jgi:SAM-dependent methyltransferase